jgi:hypothetical protein
MVFFLIYVSYRLIIKLLGIIPGSVQDVNSNDDNVSIDAVVERTKIGIQIYRGVVRIKLTPLH